MIKTIIKIENKKVLMDYENNNTSFLSIIQTVISLDYQIQYRKDPQPTKKIMYLINN
jgi:hypothetical protein